MQLCFAWYAQSDACVPGYALVDARVDAPCSLFHRVPRLAGVVTST